MVIYVYADLKKVAADFHGPGVEERVRNFLEFQKGFEEAVPHSEVVLADLDVSNTTNKIYLECQ